MQIDINSIDKEQFAVKPNLIAGDLCYLVYPLHIGAKWTKHNDIFRSSIWSKDGKPVSLSYKKFYNWSEQPDLHPHPKSIKDCVAVNKIDGSTLIVSYYKGELIARTRGTFDARGMDNGNEIDILKQKYPQAFDNDLLRSENYSMVFEWVSPQNIIVLKYGDEADLYLTNVIDHSDYSYWTQAKLDLFASKIGVQRPGYKKYESIDSLLQEVKILQGEEGVCLYFDGDQYIRKIKSEHYLAIHAFKSECSLEKIVDIYMSSDKKDFHSFQEEINKSVNYDYECMNVARGFISLTIDAYKEVLTIKDCMREFVEPLKKMPRKDAALKITSSYGNTNRASFAFTLLDGKELTKDQEKKLIWQCLKK